MIVVLEDDARRQNSIREAATELLSELELVFFDNARKLEDWLHETDSSGIHAPAGSPPNSALTGPDGNSGMPILHQVQLFSLDCDLDSTQARGEYAGNGMEFIEFLLANQHRCPVIVHSSNALRAPAMHMALSLAGWPNVVLSPFTDGPSWAGEVQELLCLHRHDATPSKALHS